MKHSKLPARLSGLVLIFILFNCNKSVEPTPPLVVADQPTIRQGIWGKVMFWEGDFMPSYPPSQARGTVVPVIREIYAYQLTNLHEVDQVSYSPFFRRIFTQLVDSTLSNSAGFFQLSLMPGQYSIFIKEDSLYYANGGDGYGNIQPALVQKDSLTKLQINITYKASF